MLLMKPHTYKALILALRASQSNSCLYAGTEITGVCRNRGAVGGLQALTALETHFARVSLQALPVQGGFHAAYSGIQTQWALYKLPRLNGMYTVIGTK